MGGASLVFGVERTTAIAATRGWRFPAMLQRSFLRPTVFLSIGAAANHASFIPPATYIFDFEAPISMAVGDFNGDGIPDLAVANLGRYTLDNGWVSILLGNGDGTFQGPKNYPAGIEPSFLVVGDFNGDGIADLAV